MIIGWKKSAYLDESRSRLTFWLGLICRSPDEAICSAADGVFEEEAMEIGGEYDELC